MNLDQAELWVQNVLNMAVPGGDVAHVIELTDTETGQLGTHVEHAGIGPRGDMVIETHEGKMFRVTLEEIDPETGSPLAFCGPR